MSYLQEIKHVVWVMFENRSFDNLLGWLYEDPQDPAIRFIPPDCPAPFNGLAGKSFSSRFPTSFNDPNAYPVKKGTTDYAGKSGSRYTVPAPDPNEPFQNMHRQLMGPDVKVPPEGSTVTTPKSPAPMSGFLADYAEAAGYKGSDAARKAIALKILETYAPDQAPIISTLARWYAVSDEFYGSVPTQTNTNRAFAGTGTSQGLVNNHWNWVHLGIPYAWDTKTVWNVLMDEKKLGLDDWRIYYSELWFGDYGFRYCYTVDLFTKLYDAMKDSNMVKIDEFHTHARNGALPAFSFLEPMWYLDGHSDGPPSSYHPPSDIRHGELFLKSIFASLTATPAAREAWKDTLLIVTFDENGGCFDHQPPPPAWPPGPMGTPPVEPEYTYDFAGLGPRVPALLISPRIEKNTVFRSMRAGAMYDHASVIATLLEWQGLDPTAVGMGDRVAKAASLGNVLTLSRDKARADLPTFPPLEEPEVVDRSAVDLGAPIELSEQDKRELTQVMFFLSRHRCKGQELIDAAEAVFESRTKGELARALRSFEERFSSSSSS